MDEYYERLGNFAGLYARHVFDRMSKTVPKAIILCQVRRTGTGGASLAWGVRVRGQEGCLAPEPARPAHNLCVHLSHQLSSSTNLNLPILTGLSPLPLRLQVIRSRDRLLDQLYNYLSNLKPMEMEALLTEDPTVGRRRTAAQQASKDLADAQLEVRKIEVRRVAGRFLHWLSQQLGSGTLNTHCRARSKPQHTG